MTTDLFGNEEPVKSAKSVVRKNLSLENHKVKAEIVPAGIKTEGYDFSQIRKKFHNDKWWFAYKDVVSVLADTKNLDDYCRDLKKRMIAEGFKWCEKVAVLKLTATDGKSYRTSCFSQEDIIRLIEEIPSSKAEPLKQEIARLTNERIEEIKNPSKGVDNAVKRWKEMGKSDEWISLRLKGIAVRNLETQTLKEHGIEKPKDFAYFTDKTNVAVYGQKAMTLKAERGLVKRENLRDHSSGVELSLLALHENACAGGMKSSNAYGKASVDKVYDAVGSIISNTKQALISALGEQAVTA